MYYDVQKSAERIRNLRIGRNLTQNEAAEKMGFSIGGYRKLEQGWNGGSVDSLILVAEFFHVSLDYLVYGERQDYIGDLLEDLTENQKCIVRSNMANLVENLKNFNRGIRGAGTKVSELCTPAFEKKIIQWHYKLNRTSTHSDIFSLCRMAEWPEPISCHDNPAWCFLDCFERNI